MEQFSRKLSLALLRRFEPIVHYTSGERFFPMDVEPYVRVSSLWVSRPGENAELLVEEGQLTLEDLSQPRSESPGSLLYLKFIEPLDLAEMASAQLPWKQDGGRGGKFQPDRARLARVGYISRIADALYSLMLFARGRVPGDTAAAAAIAYEKMLKEDERFLYHGRVVRQDEWVTLQYWFFYAFNSWRSGFAGANDHESDWEMICIYLAEIESEEDASEQDGDHEKDAHEKITNLEEARAAEDEEVAAAVKEFRPEWVAYASHDYSGDDLRRRWDDPEVQKVGEHVVIYAGAGSHASYFAQGEYLTEVEMPLVSPLVRGLNWTKKFMREKMGLYTGSSEQSSILHIPFIDYARGDGLRIGPQQEVEWDDPSLISPPPSWVSEYRGLWGLYARDPFNGENAPAGPMYNRDGTTRRSWYDPVGWAGLDKVLPSEKTLDAVETHMEALKERRSKLNEEIERESKNLKGLGVEVDAMRNQPHLSEMRKERQQQLDELSAKVEHLRAELASNNALLESLALRSRQLRFGDFGSPRSHIRRAHTPITTENERIGRITEIWAAISVSVLLFVFIWAILFARHYLIYSFILIVITFTTLEATLRHRLANWMSGLGIILALVATGVLFFQFFWYWVALLILGVGGYILFENLRELAH
jgi:hypothetical protein